MLQSVRKKIGLSFKVSDFLCTLKPKFENVATERLRSKKKKLSCKLFSVNLLKTGFMDRCGRQRTKPRFTL